MSVASAGAPPISVDQYEHFDGYPGLRDELINGQIVLSPRAKPWHRQVAKTIERMLDRALQSTPYVAAQNTNIRFAAAHSMPAPDIMVVERTAWRRACLSDSYLTEPPVLVIEIISPANRKGRVEEKLRLYLMNGVEAVWLVYPKRRQVEICTGATRSLATEMVPLPAPLSGSLAAEDFFLID